jgi:hypothetical protein
MIGVLDDDLLISLNYLLTSLCFVISFCFQIFFFRICCCFFASSQNVNKTKIAAKFKPFLKMNLKNLE